MGPSDILMTLPGQHRWCKITGSEQDSNNVYTASYDAYIERVNMTILETKLYDNTVIQWSWTRPVYIRSIPFKCMRTPPEIEPSNWCPD